MARGSLLRSFSVAALLALGLLVACRQITLHGAYAAHPAYRAQVDALLDGRLALSHVPDGLIHDLAWTPSGVQQVWGLGVPLWQLPFEAVGRLFGISPFPDRVALAVWLAVMMLTLMRAFRPSDPADRRATQIGAVVLTGLLPGLVSVLRGRIGVYEEAAIYAYGAAMILLGGLVSLHRRPTARRYLLLVGFAGLTGLLRPTVWFYGLATLVVASAIVLGRHGRPALRHSLRIGALGVALFLAGGAILYASNAQRFGRGTEFGHRLNVHSLPGNIVATRFSYPFERASTVEATEELLGSLFDGPERRSKRGFYQKGLHLGQSDQPRWREYYFTTFSWPYVPAILAGLVLGALAWRRRGDAQARLLVAWAVLGGAPLVAFYLHSPSVSSRYQLDLAPAIAALLVIAWRACASRWPRRALAVLAILWAAAVATSKVTRPKRLSAPVDRQAAATSAYAISRAVGHDHRLPGAYDLADPLLPMWTDVLEDFARCQDALGQPIACDTPPLPGDVAIVGHRLGSQWMIERFALPDVPPAPVCRVPDEEEPACSAEPAVLRDPDAVLERAFLGPPARYLNGSGWDLVTGPVPPATFFYVDDAQYIALDVTGPPGTDWEREVRVAVGLEHFRLVSVAETADGARLRFEGGAHPGLEVVFIAFGPDRELDRPRSRLGLRSIRWRDQ